MAAVVLRGSFGWHNLHVRLKFIPDPTRGQDEARCAGCFFDLASQSEDLNIDAAIEDIFVKAGRLEKTLA
jgi:hypothetical protein